MKSGSLTYAAEELRAILSGGEVDDERLEGICAAVIEAAEEPGDIVDNLERDANEGRF